MRSVAMNVVTAASRPDGTAASRIHRARRPQPIGGLGRWFGRALVRLRQRRRLGRRLRGSPSTDDGHGRRRHEGQAQHGEPDRPRRPLIAEAEPGADEERVRQQGQERAAVRQGVQPVRIRARTAAPAGEPGRDERGRRREDEHRRPDRQGEDAQDVDRRREARRSDVGRAQRGDEEPGQGSQRQPDVHDRAAPWSEPRDRRVSVQVAEQEDRLEEDEHGRPGRGRAAERREHELTDEGFDPEQQERGPADGQGEDGHRPDRGGRTSSVKWEDRVDRGRAAPPPAKAVPPRPRRAARPRRASRAR